MINFAAEAGPHIAIAPETIFKIGGLQITNSNLFAWVAGAAILIIILGNARKISLKAKSGFLQMIEIGAEFVTGMLESSLGNRQKAVKYAPIFASIFFFVLFNNWFGLLPGVGPTIELNHVPLFRAFTTDLNGTAAMAIFMVITVQYLAIKENGVKNHLMHYFGGNIKNPINIFVGFLEMFAELTRVVSLSLRLFFNILIGEILISIFTYLGKILSPIATLPFVSLEIFVGLVQAYIFTMLGITYLSIATAHEGEHEADHPSVTPVMAQEEIHS